jgi:hypothetical protein
LPKNRSWPSNIGKDAPRKDGAFSPQSDVYVKSWGFHQRILFERFLMKLYRRKGSKNWYLRQGDTLISLKTARKGHALQLLEEYQAKKLGIYRVPHKKVSDFFEPYVAHCKKYNKASTIDDKQRTLGFFKNQAGDPWLRQVNTKTIVD